MKRNYFKFLLVALLAFSVTTISQAYDFKAKNSDGVTIYYHYINNKKELEVAQSSDYSGNVVIPKIVTIEKRAIKVTAIGKGAFCNCTGLKKVYIPNSVTTIGELAFISCTNITTLIVKCITPFNIDKTIFPDCVFNNAALYIPKGTMQIYKTTACWNEFLHIAEGEPAASIPSK